MKKAFLFLATVLVFCSLSGQNKNDILKYTSKKTQFGFVENKGQIYNQNHKVNNEVKYLLSLGNGMNVQLKKNSFSYDTYKKELSAKDNSFNFHRVDVELIGANANPDVIAEEPSSNFTNYYNAVATVTNVHNYKRVTYKDIYPGIDMVFTAQLSSDKPVEYTFVVHPGADANKIQLHYAGANKTQLNDNKINLEVVNGSFSENIPASWINETNSKVAVSYKNTGKDIYGFNIPSYSADQTLIIDPNPNLDWATYAGGTGNEVGIAVSTDSQGNVVITGTTNSAAAIATTGANQSTIGGGIDVFVIKYDNDGVIQWGTYYGGTGDDRGNGIACDNSGNIYITGTTNSPNAISTGPTVYQPAPGGGTDAFIAKFSTAGALTWGTYYGGTGNDEGNGIYSNATGDIYIVGTTNSSGAISSTGSYQVSFGGGANDAYFAKFNTSGTRQYASYFGGTGDDQGKGIACDASGNVSITGFTNSTANIASTSTSHQSTFGGGTYDAFVAKFMPSGVIYNFYWGAYLGGSNNDQGSAVTCDGAGDVYITGTTSSVNNIYSTSSGSLIQTTLGGGSDIFVTKYKANGNETWSTYYGGTGNEVANGIVCDNQYNVFVTGYTNSSSSIATPSSYQGTYGGGTTYGDAFAIYLSSAGTAPLLWGTYFGGTADDYANGIALDGAGNVFVTGATSSSSAIATFGANQTTIGGGTDAFLARFSTCFLPTNSIGAAIYGQSPMCLPEDDSVKYSIAPITNAVQNVWTLPNGTNYTTSATFVWLHFSQYNPGDSTLHLSVYGINSCGVGPVISLDIPLNAKPQPPVISYTGNQGVGLKADSASGIQWYVGSSMISGATSQNWIATTNGDYHATVTVNGCTSDWSNILTINSVGIDVNQNNTGIKVYPNPVSDELILESEGNTTQLNYDIYNTIGQIVYSGTLIEKTIVPTANLASGVYLLKLSNGKTIDFKKIVKE